MCYLTLHFIQGNISHQSDPSLFNSLQFFHGKGAYARLRGDGVPIKLTKINTPLVIEKRVIVTCKVWYSGVKEESRLHSQWHVHMPQETESKTQLPNGLCLGENVFPVGCVQNFFFVLQKIVFASRSTWSVRKHPAKDMTHIISETTRLTNCCNLIRYNILIKNVCSSLLQHPNSNDGSRNTP